MRYTLSIMLLILGALNINAQCNEECANRTVYGFDAGDSATGNSSALFGVRAGWKTTALGEKNSFFGYDSGFETTSGAENCFYGYQSGYKNTTGGTNNFVGYQSGYNNSSGSTNNFFGYQSGYTNGGTSGNSFYGHQSGYSNTFGDSLCFFGFKAGYNNFSADFNTFIGNHSGFANVSGIQNTFVGSNTGRNNTGSTNSFFGDLSGTNNTWGFSNSFYGAESGRNNITGVGNSCFGAYSGYKTDDGWTNTFIGGGSGFENVSGSGNSCLGANSGNEILGDSNVVIGITAGPPPGDGDVSFRLFIDIEQSSNPLIYGEFDNDLLRINGELEVMGAISPPSSRTVKQDFQDVDKKEILDKIKLLSIETWSYIDKPDIRHIGPISEEFYDSFGVGKNDSSISTIDADGVALAAIQALISELEHEKYTSEKRYASLQKENEDLKQLVNDLAQKVELLLNE